jgi:hypothetical protein
MRSIGHSIGIPFFVTGGLPLVQYLLRFLDPQVGNRIYDLINIYDAEENTPGLIDMDPDSLGDPDIEFQIMDRSNVTIWSEVDKDGNTIRDLSGYDVLNPFDWLKTELTVDVFDTYISATYLDRLFANFDTRTQLAVYDRQLTCPQRNFVHSAMQTGNVWMMNRGVINGCGIIKADGVIWSP